MAIPSGRAKSEKRRARIGLAFAQTFLGLGNTVIITGRRQDKLEAAKQAHPELHIVQCDAADPAQVAELGRRMAADFPALDVLFNNAGIFIYRNLTVGSGDLVELTQELDVNLAGPIRTVSALVDQLRNTKAALHSYTVTLRQQLKGQVEVIELLPPAVKTELTADIPEDGEFKLITLEQLLAATVPALRAGDEEIRPGQSSQLHWMSRIAPGFINGQLAKGSATLVPTP